MTDREKLIELIRGTPDVKVWPDAGAKMADYLIANGVTVQKRGWIVVYPGSFHPYSCSECGNCHGRKVNFCSVCGTKLDLPQPPKENEA